jgi:hypothetical protein
MRGNPLRRNGGQIAGFPSTRPSGSVGSQSCGRPFSREPICMSQPSSIRWNGLRNGRQTPASPTSSSISKPEEDPKHESWKAGRRPWRRSSSLDGWVGSCRVRPEGGVYPQRIGFPPIYLDKRLVLLRKDPVAGVRRRVWTGQRCGSAYRFLSCQSTSSSERFALRDVWGARTEMAYHTRQRKLDDRTLR